MSLVRGIKCSAGAAMATAAAWAGAVLVSGNGLAMAPILIGGAAGLGMAVANKGKDTSRAGTIAAICGGVAVILGGMGIGVIRGAEGAMNPFNVLMDLGPMGIMSLIVGLCAAWWLGGRETVVSTSLASNPVVSRMSATLEGPLGAVSREVDQSKRAERKAA